MPRLKVANCNAPVRDEGYVTRRKVAMKMTVYKHSEQAHSGMKRTHTGVKPFWRFTIL